MLATIFTDPKCHEQGSLVGLPSIGMIEDDLHEFAGAE